MRYVKVSLIPTEGDIDPVSGEIQQEPSLTREAILHINRLNDGTVVLLTQLRGDNDALLEILEDHPAVISYNVSSVRDGLQAYIHAEPTRIASGLLSLTQQHEFVLDTPIEYGPEGGFRVALIGQEETVRRAIEDVPEGIRVELEQLSDYDPELRELSSLLTDRQREILNTAADLGYYEVPRRATHQDIADELDLSTTTVGEHLRKIEARMLSEIAH
ncbi:helix-turn-helix domain-containing protein [Natronomonas halophila]|uniref:helix-turn-helix domain-containing protein n=1 Tax=Natronomonas halophila TaxID=2747817 RepID=UPI0015B6285D|nr:helix-turn-helix domain-containing protein [Natronomonas halophila]QLD87337.1 helix-turn-helix domain-containing protein [Natronomonas halophila]